MALLSHQISPGEPLRGTIPPNQSSANHTLRGAEVQVGGLLAAEADTRICSGKQASAGESTGAAGRAPGRSPVQAARGSFGVFFLRDSVNRGVDLARRGHNFRTKFSPEGWPSALGLQNQRSRSDEQ